MMFRSFLKRFGGQKALKCSCKPVSSHNYSTLVPVSRIVFLPSVHFQHNFDISKRHKSKIGKKGAKPTDSLSETDSDVRDEFEEKLDKSDKNSKVMSVTTKSLRVDALLKAGLGLARNKIETLFYESKIRVNGKKLLKKSEDAQEGDELDVVKTASPTNPDFLIVARVELLSVREKGESFSVKLRRCKSLTIENYIKEYD